MGSGGPKPRCPGRTAVISKDERIFVMPKRILSLLKGDAVLAASLCLALFSCFLVPPGPRYVEYLDFNTLILLFCLMLIIEGLRQENFLQMIGNRILGRVSTTRGVALTLVFLCFFSSMFITNDVSLITFVPFGILVLNMAGLTERICYTVTLMTIAANLGSMFTPMGNPQNLYLFSLSGLSIPQFLLLTGPYVLAAGILLLLFVFPAFRKEGISPRLAPADGIKKGAVCFYLILFVCCLLTVAGLVPHALLLAAVSVAVAVKNRKLFLHVDYSLLLTFVFFFIFVGNLRRAEGLHSLISSLVLGRERLLGVLMSQAISNVPAAMLLSGYTDRVQELIVGTNLGGLGTLIASMASLISYKQIAGGFPEQKRNYFKIFTGCNLAFLALLCLLSLFL